MANDIDLWISNTARRLFAAARERSPIAESNERTSEDREQRLAAAYDVQHALIAQHLTEGDRVVGYKVAITSRSKLAELSLASPIVGKLLATGSVPSGGTVSADMLIRPRIEPEVAFVMDKPLRGPHCTVVDVARALAYVAPAFEILDSRYLPGAFDAFAAVADNVSASKYVLGPQQISLSSVDLPLIGCLLHRNGEIVATGAGGQVLGHPIQSVVALVNDLAIRGEALEAGAIILAGGLIEARQVQPGDHWRASFHTLGEVSVSFV